MLSRRTVMLGLAGVGLSATASAAPSGRVADVDPVAPSKGWQTFGGGRLLRIPADPGAGYHAPGFLYLPPGLSGPRTLVVVGPNNIISSSQGDTDAVLLGLLEWMRAEYGDATGTPLLMPAFLRPPEPGILHELFRRHDNLDTHSLRRDALLTERKGFRRIDLQTLALIDAARAALRPEGVEAERRVIYAGWSAAGSFGDRMSALHPDRTKALVVGGFGATPLLPVAELGGERLLYPLGTADMEAITGRPFQAARHAEIPYLLMHGTDDPNDPLPGVDRFGRQQRRVAQEVLGRRPMDRVDTVRDVFARAGHDAFELRLYPGVDHGGSRDIAIDMGEFIREHALGAPVER